MMHQSHKMNTYVCTCRQMSPNKEWIHCMPCSLTSQLSYGHHSCRLPLCSASIKVANHETQWPLSIPGFADRTDQTDRWPDCTGPKPYAWPSHDRSNPCLESRLRDRRMHQRIRPRSPWLRRGNQGHLLRGMTVLVCVSLRVDKCYVVNMSESRDMRQGGKEGQVPLAAQWFS